MSGSLLVVAALGGNALLKPNQAPEAEIQRVNVAAATAQLAGLADAHQLIITHGNGPQIGLLALQNDAYAATVRPYPLDVLDAESAGMVGYLIEQELGRHLGADQLATLLTQVVVNIDDPAFQRPTKPIGPSYERDDASRLKQEKGWRFVEGAGGWRRVVPSPEPLAIVELQTIRILLDHNVTVVCAGGGGIPVVLDEGGLRGVEAVIDKDLVSSLLATELSADALLLLTDVDAVYEQFGTPSARAIRTATPIEMRRHRFPPGSMGPKVEAGCRFVENGGRFAVVGALEHSTSMLSGGAGTRIQM